MASAYEIPGFSYTLPAASDLTGSQYRFVDINSSLQATTPTAGGRVVGVRQNKPNTGQATTIVHGGISIVQGGEAITAGANVATAATGKAMTADEGDEVVGVAFTACGADDEYMAVLLGTSSAVSSASVDGTKVNFPITLANITGAGDVVTALTMGFAGTITRVDFVVTVPVTTAAKAATLNVEIGTTNLTGGAVALTSANCTPMGAVIAGSAVTGANTFTATDTISIEAASVTAFSEGQGYLSLTIV